MQTIPLIDTPSQSLRVLLASQSCRIDVRQFGASLYLDLYVSDVLIVGGVVCRNLGEIVLNDYLGFVGDLMFVDTQGASDPASPGLGTRFLLVYVEQADLDAAAAATA
jgi:hypothetical protein